MTTASEYVSNIRRNYSHYILQNRAIPSICDGFISSMRRIVWTAKNGQKVKSATLAGSTMPIHPHNTPESTVDTLTCPYRNNIPILKGFGTFGTLLAPTACSASRYTSVMLSDFCKEAVLVDMDLVPLQENYDSTLMEPTHFLPLIPIVLLNPIEGIAIGYSCNILPHNLSDIINAQIQYLSKQTITIPTPHFLPTNQIGIQDEKNPNKWIFKGKFDIINSTTIRITDLPYGLIHAKYVTNEDSKLNKLIDDQTIVDYVDKSCNIFDIQIKFPRGYLASIDAENNPDGLLKVLGLITSHTSNNTILDTNSQIQNLSTIEIIQQFCDWRITYYRKRYELLVEQLLQTIQRYKDFIVAIEHQAGKIAATTKNKQEFKTWLESIKIVHSEYIATLPSYRYTIEEQEKVTKLLKEANKQLDEYNSIINSDTKQRNIYKKELTEILHKFG